MEKTNPIYFTFCLIALMIVSGCAPKVEPQPAAGLPNPASENCIKQGGELMIEKGPVGEYGVCVFEDNRQCEEWALFKGECPIGGLKITGYVTPAAVYCVITGGDYAIKGESNSDQEQGTCTFKTGKSCDVWEYYEGRCNQ